MLVTVAHTAGSGSATVSSKTFLFVDQAIKVFGTVTFCLSGFLTSHQTLNIYRFRLHFVFRIALVFYLLNSVVASTLSEAPLHKYTV